MKIKTFSLLNCLGVICFCIAALLLYLANNRRPNRARKIYGKEPEQKIDDRHDIHNVIKTPDPFEVRKLREIKKIIQQINEQQHLIKSGNYSDLDFYHTVLVISVHPDIAYLTLFLESIRRIVGIGKSLLIFAHDCYNEDINEAIMSMRFARVMQVFYPYSVQLHPNVYPDQDSRFCQELSVCKNSGRRNPILSQNKLFWWWVTNQVFDHIGILRSYDGYIYFLETRQYLTNDFIFMAKVIERLKPRYCSECRFLSLGAWPPQSELYRPNNSALVVGVWGWSKYSNAGFGFNRTTWNEIKALKEQFCYFEDASWENSLKHVALNMRENNFFMLSIEAPRFFPTTGCGAFRNGTHCDLRVIFRDISKFIPTIRYKFTAHSFTLKFDSSITSNEVKAQGQWGDARDRDLCMFFSSKASRMYYA